MARKQNKTPVKTKSAHSSINTKRGGKITKKTKNDNEQNKNNFDSKTKCVKCSKFISKLNKSKMCQLCLKKEANTSQKDKCIKGTISLMSKTTRKTSKRNDNVKKSISTSSPTSSKDSSTNKKVVLLPNSSKTRRNNTRGNKINSGNKKSKTLENDFKIKGKVVDPPASKQSDKNMSLRGKKRSYDQINSVSSNETPAKKTRTSNKGDNLRGSRNKKPTVKGSEWLNTINLKKTNVSQKDTLKSKATNRSPKIKTSLSQIDKKGISTKASEVKSTRANTLSVIRGRKTETTKFIPKKQTKKNVTSPTKPLRVSPSKANTRVLKSKRNSSKLTQQSKCNPSLELADTQQTIIPTPMPSNTQQIPLKDNLSKAIRKKFSSCFTEKHKVNDSGLKENVQVVREILHDILNSVGNNVNDVTLKSNSKTNKDGDTILETGVIEEIQMVSENQTNIKNVQTHEFSDILDKIIPTQTKSPNLDCKAIDSTGFIVSPLHATNNECNSNNAITDDGNLNNKNSVETNVSQEDMNKLPITNILIKNETSHSCDDAANQTCFESPLNVSDFKSNSNSEKSDVAHSEDFTDNPIDNMKLDTDCIKSKQENSVEDTAAHLKQDNVCSLQGNKCSEDSDLDSSNTCLTKVDLHSKECDSHDLLVTKNNETIGSPDKIIHEEITTFVAVNVPCNNELKVKSNVDEKNRIFVEKDGTVSSLEKQKPNIFVDEKHKNILKHCDSNKSLHSSQEKNHIKVHGEVNTLIACEDNMKKGHEKNTIIESDIPSAIGCHVISSKEYDIDTKDEDENMECVGSTRRCDNENTSIKCDSVCKSQGNSDSSASGECEVNTIDDNTHTKSDKHSIRENSHSAAIKILDSNSHILKESCDYKNDNHDCMIQREHNQDSIPKKSDDNTVKEQNDNADQSSSTHKNSNKCSTIEESFATTIKEPYCRKPSEDNEDCMPKECDVNKLEENAYHSLAEQIDNTHAQSNKCHIVTRSFDNKSDDLESTKKGTHNEDSKTMECDLTFTEHDNDLQVKKIGNIDLKQNQCITHEESHVNKNKDPDDNKQIEKNEYSKPRECDDNTIKELQESYNSRNNENDSTKQRELNEVSTPRDCDDNSTRKHKDNSNSEQINNIHFKENQCSIVVELVNNINKEPNDTKRGNEDSKPRECDDNTNDKSPVKQIDNTFEKLNECLIPVELTDSKVKLVDSKATEKNDSNAPRENEDSQFRECDSNLHSDQIEDGLSKQSQYSIHRVSCDGKHEEPNISKQRENFEDNTYTGCHIVSKLKADDYTHDDTLSKQNQDSVPKPCVDNKFKEHVDNSKTNQNKDSSFKGCDESHNKEDNSDSLQEHHINRTGCEESSFKEHCDNSLIDNNEDSVPKLNENNIILKLNDDDSIQEELDNTGNIGNVHTPKEVQCVDSIEVEGDTCQQECNRDQSEFANQLILSSNGEDMCNLKHKTIMNEDHTLSIKESLLDTPENNSICLGEENEINIVLTDKVSNNIQDSKVIPTKEEGDHDKSESIMKDCNVAVGLISTVQHISEDKTIKENGVNLNVDIDKSSTEGSHDANDCNLEDESCKMLNIDTNDSNITVECDSSLSKIENTTALESLPMIEKLGDNLTKYCETDHSNESDRRNKEANTSENEQSVKSSICLNSADEIHSAENAESNKCKKNDPSNAFEQMSSHDGITDLDKIGVLPGNVNQVSVPEVKIIQEVPDLEGQSEETELLNHTSCVTSPLSDSNISACLIYNNSKCNKEDNEINQCGNELGHGETNGMVSDLESSSTHFKEGNNDRLTATPASVGLNNILLKDDQLPLESQDYMEVDNIDNRDNESNISEVNGKVKPVNEDNMNSDMSSPSEDNVNSQTMCHDSIQRSPSKELTEDSITDMDIDIAKETSSEHLDTKHCENNQNDLKMECS